MNLGIIDVSIIESPVSIILGIVYLVALAVITIFYCNNKIIKWFSSLKVAVVLTLLLLFLIAIEGVFGLHLYHSIYFIITAFLFITSLGLVTFNSYMRKSKVGIMLNHTGLFIVSWAMFFGAADYVDARMIVSKEETNNNAYMQNGLIVPLPFNISLSEFKIDYYDDGATPQQFISKLMIDGREHSVSVNSPITYRNYKIYQSGYDVKHQLYTVLQIVYDPWLWVVWLGLVILVTGALIMMFK